MEDKLILIDDIPEEKRGGPTPEWIKRLFIKRKTKTSRNSYVTLKPRDSKRQERHMNLEDDGHSLVKILKEALKERIQKMEKGYENLFSKDIEESISKLSTILEDIKNGEGKFLQITFGKEEEIVSFSRIFQKVPIKELALFSLAAEGQLNQVKNRLFKYLEE